MDSLSFASDRDAPIRINESGEQRQVELTVDGKLQLKGNVAAIANPMIEVGLIHARALLEFLGLGVRDGKLIPARRRHDDIAVEQFSTPNVRLTMVTPSDVFAAYPGPQEEAERALVAIFEWTNKGLAHLTTGGFSHNYTEQHLDLACRGIRALLHNYLYAKLGREMPAPPSTIPPGEKF
jgi:hypothetical protein